jgi:steroid delta-isomerase-like uncharacterized protein
MAADNKHLAHLFYEEVFNPGEVDRVEEVCRPDFVDHEEGLGLPEGIEGVKAYIRMFHDAFPDVRATVEDVISEGDKVVARVSITGTHQGELMGVPASGSSVQFESIDIVRVQDGKAAEHWGVTDAMALMQQIGAVPADATA